MSLTNREEGILGYLEGATRRHVIGSDPFNMSIPLWAEDWHRRQAKP